MAVLKNERSTQLQLYFIKKLPGEISSNFLLPYEQQLCVSWNKSVQNCSDDMRAWLCPRGQSDFTLHSRAALTVHTIQSYSVLCW